MKKILGIACAAMMGAAAYADADITNPENDASAEVAASEWSYEPGDGIYFGEQQVVYAELAVGMDSKYMNYGFCDNKDPILTAEAYVTFFDWLSVGFSTIFDMTHYGLKAGYANYAWNCNEFHPYLSIAHEFSPEDYDWLPTKVAFEIWYDYEYQPRGKWLTGGDRMSDTQFWNLKIELPDLWIAPEFWYERDVMRDNGTYLELKLKHSFALIDDEESEDEDADPILAIIPSIAQGFGNSQRVEAYAGIDKAGLTGTCLRCDLKWQVCDNVSLGCYVAYWDFWFDRKIREAARDYEASGVIDSSYNFLCGLSVNVAF